MLKRKYHDFIQDENTNINHSITKILYLLENLSSRLEKCENQIKYLVDSKIKEEQEKLEQRKHDEEIFRSYIN